MDSILKGSATQAKHLDLCRAAGETRSATHSRGEQRCAQGTLAVRTPRQQGVPEEVATTSKHVGTTLRKMKDSREELPTDGAGRNTQKTLCKASRWGYSQPATGRGAGNELSTACTSTERSNRV